MNTQAKVEILAIICTKDQSGKHFASIYSDADLSALEAEGLLEINRPIHAATNIPYSSEYWTVRVTDEGAELVDANPEYCPSI